MQNKRIKEYFQNQYMEVIIIWWLVPVVWSVRHVVQLVPVVGQASAWRKSPEQMLRWVLLCVLWYMCKYAVNIYVCWCHCILCVCILCICMCVYERRSDAIYTRCIGYMCYSMYTNIVCLHISLEHVWSFQFVRRDWSAMNRLVIVEVQISDQLWADLRYFDNFWQGCSYLVWFVKFARSVKDLCGPNGSCSMEEQTIGT